MSTDKYIYYDDPIGYEPKMKRTADSQEEFAESWKREMRSVIGFYPLDEDVKRFWEIRDEVLDMIDRKAATLKFKEG